MYKIYMQAAFNVPNWLANSSLWETDRHKDRQTDGLHRQIVKGCKVFGKEHKFLRLTTHHDPPILPPTPSRLTRNLCPSPVSIQHCNFFCLSAHNQVSISSCCLKIFLRNYAKACRIPQSQRTVLVKSCQRSASPWRVATGGSTRNYTVQQGMRIKVVKQAENLSLIWIIYDFCKYYY